ncbi:MAG: protein kinase [Lachnospiraceae bacterium]|nr:protein kinase [Lachnospiraceae bacterium]
MIDNYNGWCIGECIGSGSFGKVYRIYKDNYGHVQEAALKVMELPQSNSELTLLCSEGMTYDQAEEYYKDIIEDMGKEFKLMSVLKGHPNIVNYEDHNIIPKTDEFGWTIYIKMELLTPLLQYSQEHELQTNDIITLGIHICQALELCTNHNILHLDIKPENIFISESGDYKLGDFGIARELDKAVDNSSQNGTKNYMAPEVFRGTEYDATADIYSLGIVLYRFLNNNRLPFLPPAPVQVRYSDYEQAMQMRLDNELIHPPCNASPDLAEIILKAISFNPERRYQNPTQMKLELEKLLQSDNNSTPVRQTADKAAAFESSRSPDSKDIQAEDSSDDYMYLPPIDEEPFIANTDDFSPKRRLNVPLIIGMIVIFLLIGIIAYARAQILNDTTPSAIAKPSSSPTASPVQSTVPTTDVTKMPASTLNTSTNLRKEVTSKPIQKASKSSSNTKKNNSKDVVKSTSKNKKNSKKATKRTSKSKKKNSKKTAKRTSKSKKKNSKKATKLTSKNK